MAFSVRSAAALLSFAIVQPLRADSAWDAEIEDFLRRKPEVTREIVRDYLMEHPQVLREALGELLRRDEAEADAKARQAVRANAEKLFHSPLSVVLGNPEGDVTLVEFFDYNCAYCRQALPHVLSLLESDPKLRLVLKEMPVLGVPSMEAARVGAALALQDSDGSRYRRFHQTLLSSRTQANRQTAMAAAIEAGADASRLEADYSSGEVAAALAEASSLGTALGLTGTPSYVIGDRIVKGAVGLAALERAIAVERQEVSE